MKTARMLILLVKYEVLIMTKNRVNLLFIDFVQNRYILTSEILGIGSLVTKQQLTMLFLRNDTKCRRRNVSYSPSFHPFLTRQSGEKIRNIFIKIIKTNTLNVDT